MFENTFFASLGGVEIDGEAVTPKLISWYPNRVAWQLSLSRNIIRKNTTLQRLHKFLIAEAAHVREIGAVLVGFDIILSWGLW